VRKLLISALIITGCGAAQSPEVRPLVAENRRPEMQEMPLNAQTEPLPEDTPTDLPESYVEPIEMGQCIPVYGTTVPPSEEEQTIPGPCPEQSGVFVSEARANRDVIYRIRYREMRRSYEADRQVWSAHRELYEAQIAADRDEIENLQPTWFEQHDGEIMAAVGVVVGAAIAVAITFAVNQASE